MAKKENRLIPSPNQNSSGLRGRRSFFFLTDGRLGVVFCGERQQEKWATIEFAHLHPLRERAVCSGFFLNGTKTFVPFLSLGKVTDISPEFHPGGLVYLYLEEELILNKGKKESTPSPPFDSCLIPKEVFLCRRSNKGRGYAEIHVRKEIEEVKSSVKAEEVFYHTKMNNIQKEGIANRNLRPNDKRKSVRMALDKGQEPSPYRVPDNALVFLLEAVAVLTDEGKDYGIKVREEFRFETNGSSCLKGANPL